MRLKAEPWCEPPKSTWEKNMSSPPSMRSSSVRPRSAKCVSIELVGTLKPEVELLETKDMRLPRMLSME